jgi:predicted metal-dependent HD superfamily phosphohydrolase
LRAGVTGDDLQGRWHDLADRLGLDRGHRVYAKLAACHSEPQRHYHTLKHVAECLRLLDELHETAGDPDVLELALWFHDAVCDTRARDNEERSAELARQTLRAVGAKWELSDRVAVLIRATDHTLGSKASGDAALICDLDLASLGAEKPTFDLNTDLIRREYDWVDDAEFDRSCIAFFQDLLAREQIYRTPAMRARFEERARANLAQSLNSLRAPARG